MTRTVTIHGKHGKTYKASAWAGVSDGMTHWELVVDRVGGGTECVQRGHSHLSVSQALDHVHAIVQQLEHQPPAPDDPAGYV